MYFYNNNTLILYTVVSTLTETLGQHQQVNVRIYE